MLSTRPLHFDNPVVDQFNIATRAEYSGSYSSQIVLGNMRHGFYDYNKWTKLPSIIKIPPLLTRAAYGDRGASLTPIQNLSGGSTRNYFQPPWQVGKKTNSIDSFIDKTGIGGITYVDDDGDDQGFIRGAYGPHASSLPVDEMWATSEPPNVFGLAQNAAIDPHALRDST